MNEHVSIERRAGHLAIKLTRPAHRNAITVAMYAALADAFEQSAADPAVRVISLSGEGDDFTAGNDLGDFLEALPGDSDDIPVWRLLRAMVRCETPIVAAVHGNCIGIGTTILLHCDLVVAEDDARFSMPFVDLGLVPEAGSSLLMPRLGGRRRAARGLLLAEAFGPGEAEAIGLISHRAAPGALDARLEEIVAALLAKPAEALRQTHQLLRMGQREEVLERMQVEGRLFAQRLQSDEVKEAIAAFFAARANR